MSLIVALQEKQHHYYCSALWKIIPCSCECWTFYWKVNTVDKIQILVISYIAILVHICTDKAEWNTSFCSNKNNERGKPVLKILFFWTRTLLWRVLGAVWKHSTKEASTGLLLFLYSVNFSKIFKAIGESAFFLMALSALERGDRVGRIKFS